MYLILTQLFSSVSAIVSSNVKFLHHVRGFWAFLEEDGDADEAVIEDLGQTDEAEAHAEAQKSTRAGDVGNSAHLFRLPESLGVGLLDEDVDDGEVALGVVVDLTLDAEG